ncbi:hypothetical protein [Pollutibacter soli]|uniref:hypothetical protein n=1 Tax=Pollutibacter soli TaxID=3034157 RepID=UPI003013388B
MKIKYILATASLAVFIFNSTFAQETKIYQKIKDHSGNEMLLGKCDPSALKQEPFAAWYYSSWQNYTLDSITCNFIRPLLANKKLKLFMGTWCDDSRREVPRIFKMLECCNFPMENLELIMVSNADTLYKQSPLHEERGLNILRVPTMIIYSNGIETGRIVEFPMVSLEKDLLAILRGQKYTLSYTGEVGSK